MKRGVPAIGMMVVVMTMLITACYIFRNVGEIIYLYEVVYVYEEEITGEPAASRVEFEYSIMHFARIRPLVVGGHTTQANDIVIRGTIALIVYNTAGDPFAGAIQVIDISPRWKPVITTEIALPEMDVNAVHVTDTDIYIAGAANPDFIPGYVDGNRAFVVRIPRADLATIDSATISARRVILTGLAANGIAEKDGILYVTTGAVDGELEILNAALVPDTGIPGYHDLRDVERYHGGVIALQGAYQGEGVDPLDDGRVLFFKEDGALRKAIPITGFDSFGTRSTIEVYDNHYAFLGLSDAGFEAHYLKQDVDDPEPTDLLFKIANPTVQWTTETDTRSVSYNEDLIFTANGEAGFRVFRVTGNLSQDAPPSELGEKIGLVPFDETLQPGGHYWSANHVEYRDRVLVVACGPGGVNFYRFVR